MSSIKKFFAKTKSDLKFKKAGRGHKLSEDSSAAHVSSSAFNTASSRPRQEPNTGVKQAGAAALARFEKHEQNTVEVKMAARSIAVIRAEARKELEKEQKEILDAGVTAIVLNPVVENMRQKLDVAPMLAVSGVYFSCPLIGPEVLPRPEMEEKIKEFLYEQLSEERGLTSCLIIHTCNKNREKVQLCVDTLTKYFDNIMANPTEDKYRKIRLSNKVFQEKVSSIEGSLDLLQAAGFEQKFLSVGEDLQEEFLVFTPSDKSSIDELTVLKDGLLEAEPILPQLVRSMKVLKLTASSANIVLPSEFFNLTLEELKREQALKAEQAELYTQLRTKAMREKDENREQRRYKYTLIRIRFPDGIYLQGTFKVRETVEDLRNFIQENLHSDWLPYNLTSPTGQKISNIDATFFDLHLLPAAVVHFSCDQAILDDIKAHQRGKAIQYLRDETLALLHEI